MGLLPQPCFFKGRGFGEIICLACKEFEYDFLCVIGLDPTILTLAGGANDGNKVIRSSTSEILENGVIFGERT